MNGTAENNNQIKKPKKLFGIKITKKRVIWTVVILVIFIPILIGIFKGDNPADSIVSEIVKKQDLKQTVLATGQVVSQTDLSLSFKTSGIVARVNVKEGQKVMQGEVLASVDQRDSVARLTQARGAFAQAQANYQKVLDGASSEDIVVSQVTLDNAKNVLETVKQQQDTAVKNAYNALLNSTISAVANPSNSGSATATISGTYNSEEQGIYKITINNNAFILTGLESAGGDVKTTPVPLGRRGLYIVFSGTTYNGDYWTIKIPNTLASTYITNYNAYQTALEARKSAITTAENTVAAAQAALDLKKIKARPADLQAVQAAVTSALGQVQAAEADLENTIIRAPAAGTITKVDVKPGELASAQSPVIVLQDVGNLHVEVNISEANIALVKEGQEVDVTFDALGMDRHFVAKVATVNPAATIVSGVVNYKVTATLDNLEEIKPGMTANMTVLTGEKQGVLAVPQRAVISNGKKIVRVIIDPKKKTYEEVEVETGIEADGGLVEIISGLNEGQEAVTFIKK